MQEHKKHASSRRPCRTPFDPDTLAAATAGAGSHYRLIRDDRPRGETLLEGRFTVESLGVELQVHASDALELESARASILLPPSLTVSLLLNGRLDATLDGLPLRLSTREGPSGHLWLHRRPVRLERRIRAGQRVRKVNISLPIDALAAFCEQDRDTVTGCALHVLLAREALALLPWTPSRQSLRCAEDLLGADGRGRVLTRIMTGISALTIVHDALAQLAGAEPVTPDRPITARDAARAHQARHYIVRHLDRVPRLADIARHTAMSVSTLQRVFKSCFGMTVFEFIRVRRLEHARDMLCRGGVPVAEAAYRAGYSSAANFATAFRQEFGYPPSHVQAMPGSARSEKE